MPIDDTYKLRLELDATDFLQRLESLKRQLESELQSVRMSYEDINLRLRPVTSAGISPPGAFFTTPTQEYFYSMYRRLPTPEEEQALYQRVHPPYLAGTPFYHEGIAEMILPMQWESLRRVIAPKEVVEETYSKWKIWTYSERKAYEERLVQQLSNIQADTTANLLKDYLKQTQRQSLSVAIKDVEDYVAEKKRRESLSLLMAGISDVLWLASFVTGGTLAPVAVAASFATAIGAGILPHLPISAEPTTQLLAQAIYEGAWMKYAPGILEATAGVWRPFTSPYGFGLSPREIMELGARWHVELAQRGFFGFQWRSFAEKWYQRWFGGFIPFLRPDVSTLLYEQVGHPVLQALAVGGAITPYTGPALLSERWINAVEQLVDEFREFLRQAQPDIDQKTLDKKAAEAASKAAQVYTSYLYPTFGLAPQVMGPAYRELWWTAAYTKLPMEVVQQLMAGIAEQMIQYAGVPRGPALFEYARRLPVYAAALMTTMPEEYVRMAGGWPGIMNILQAQAINVMNSPFADLVSFVSAAIGQSPGAVVQNYRDLYSLISLAPAAFTGGPAQILTTIGKARLAKNKLLEDPKFVFGIPKMLFDTLLGTIGQGKRDFETFYGLLNVMGYNLNEGEARALYYAYMQGPEAMKMYETIQQLSTDSAFINKLRQMAQKYQVSSNAVILFADEQTYRKLETNREEALRELSSRNEEILQRLKEAGLPAVVRERLHELIMQYAPGGLTPEEMERIAEILEREYPKEISGRTKEALIGVLSSISARGRVYALYLPTEDFSAEKDEADKQAKGSTEAELKETMGDLKDVLKKLIDEIRHLISTIERSFVKG